MTPRKIVDAQGQVVSIEKDVGGVYRALLDSPDIARRARPLQFVNVKVGDGSDPFLRRPFSISGIHEDSGLIEITWRIVGRGTEIMSRWEPGDTVKVLGPLGNGFSLRTESRDVFGDRKQPRLWLVAGGTGLAPMYPLAQEAKELGYEVSLFFGARSKDELMDTSRFQNLGCEVHTTTEDGSAGHRGLVTEVLTRYVQVFRKGEIMVACGPEAMLGAVKSFVGHSLDLYVCLEGRMACGIGLCQGCAVKARGQDVAYLHVCSHGPVFLASDVDLGGER
ncbi:MAG: dihydroorotate dehydrogenase electron transfer subunit [Bacillota bacterium]|jgi:dihydroorotate dehydrogenase electron transfer subunit